MLGMLDRFGIRKSIDEKRPVAFAVLPPPSEGRPPAPLILVPVSDFDKFLDAFDSKEKLADEPVYKVNTFGKPSAIRHIGDYAAVTEWGSDEILYEKNLKIAEKVPADLAAWREWLAGHDAAGVILPPGIKFISANVQNGLRAMQAKLGRERAAQIGGRRLRDVREDIAVRRRKNSRAGDSASTWTMTTTSSSPTARCWSPAASGPDS